MIFQNDLSVNSILGAHGRAIAVGFTTLWLRFCLPVAVLHSAVGEGGLQ